MNLSYSLILAFVGIAGPTSAGPTSAGPTSDEPTSRPTSAFMPFENNLTTVRAEVVKYCDDPAEYDKSSLEEESGYGPIKDWDVSALTSMYGLFSPDTCPSCLFCPSCITCNPPVSNWNVSAVIMFDFMFYGAEEFNQDLSGWDVRKSYNFNSMFRGARVFNQDLSTWDVRKGYFFNGMFRGARVFNQDLSGWDVRKGHIFNHMFYGAAEFNQDLSKWGVGKGRSFKLMFKGSGMNHYIGDWLICIKIGDVCEHQLSVIGSMLDESAPVSWYKTLPLAEKQQFINLITPEKNIEA